MWFFRPPGFTKDGYSKIVCALLVLSEVGKLGEWMRALRTPLEDHLYRIDDLVSSSALLSAVEQNVSLAPLRGSQKF